ncbi:FAS1 domain-containing protein [Gymnopilus junonius]|uniref:FAS1 domain-containing protein n=1 Tax=Gymnopilus junonius TaxID=109634 RepID=A0A9P5NDX9_GYMJU|nr:FAS1 domain-containing protein [Gymnopilus junonius]
MYTKSILPLVLAASASAQSIVSVLQNQTQLSNLVTLLNSQPAVVSALTSATNITLLAPHNDAIMTFLNSPAGAAADSGTVAALLEYHVVNGAFKSTAFTTTPVFASTLLTNSSFTNVTGGQVVEAVAEQGGGVDIFSGLRAKSSVVVPDITFDGGVIHIIDTVLTIPPSVSDTATANNLTSLASAVMSAGLLTTINTTPNITVFAPTNAAFSAIASTVSGLSTSQLASVLDSRLSTMNLPTVEGANVAIMVSGSSVMVNKANVVLADVIVANGVVHVLDSVLSVPSSSGSNASSSSSTASSANSSAAGIMNMSLNARGASLAAIVFMGSLLL